MSQWTDGETKDLNDKYFADEDNLTGEQHVMMADVAKCFTSMGTTASEGNLIILLDTGSNHHVFCNPKLLKGIRHADKPLAMNTNGGDFHCLGKLVQFGSILMGLSMFYLLGCL